AESDGCERVCRTVLFDITERKRSEGMLQASEARHRMLLQSSPDAFFTLAPPNWTFCSCNTASVGLLGAALRDGSASFEWTFQRKPGEEFAATVVIARVESCGRFFLQATVRDQTEERKRRAATAQTERLVSMGLLAA